jgi:hypothetical protein
MSNRALIVAVVVANVMVSSSALVIADSSPQRQAVASAASVERDFRNLGTAERIARAERIPMACNTARCLNRRINGLVLAHNSLVADYNALSNFVNNCLKVRAVSEYSGYEFTNGFTPNTGSTFLTEAIDFTDPGDVIGADMVVEVC